jgi:O-antigen/teichoic acid export membrane protein
MFSIKYILQSASLWSVVGVGLRVGGGLLTLPLALRVLPKEQMGLYYTFLSIAAIGHLLDFGFSSTITRNASYAMAGASCFKAKGIPEMSKSGEPNLSLLFQLKDAVRTWYLIVGAILALGLLGGGSWYIARQININHLPGSISGCWLLFAFSTILTFISSYWQNLLIGIGKVLENAKILVASQTLSMLLLITGLYSGWGLWSYAIAAIAAAVINRYLVKLIFCNATGANRHSGIKIVFDKVILSALWPMAWRQGAVLLGSFMILRMNTLICTDQLGLSTTAEYGLSINVLNMIFQICSVPVTMAFPEISRLRVSQDVLRIRRLFSQRLYGGLALAALLVLIVLFYGEPILTILGSNTRLLNAQYFLILGVIYFLETHHSMYAILVMSENHNPFLLPALLSGFAIFLISWWAAPHYGVLGIILSQGIVQLLWNNWWPVLRGWQGLVKK